MSVKVTVGQQTFIKKIVLGTPVTTARETLSIDEFKNSNDPYVFQFRYGKLDGPMQPKDI